MQDEISKERSVNDTIVRKKILNDQKEIDIHCNAFEYKTDKNLILEAEKQRFDIDKDFWWDSWENYIYCR